MILEVNDITAHHPAVTSLRSRTNGIVPRRTMTPDPARVPHSLPPRAAKAPILDGAVHDRTERRRHARKRRRRHVRRPVRGRDRREQVGHIRAVRAGEADLALGAVLIRAVGTPVIDRVAVRDGIVPVGAAEVTARGVSLGQRLADLALRLGEADLARGTVRVGAVGAPVIVPVAVGDGVRPVGAAELGTRGLGVPVGTAAAGRRLRGTPDHRDVIAIGQERETDLAGTAVGGVAARAVAFQTAVRVGIGPSRTAETTVAYVGEVIEDAMAQG